MILTFSFSLKLRSLLNLSRAIMVIKNHDLPISVNRTRNTQQFSYDSWSIYQDTIKILKIDTNSVP